MEAAAVLYAWQVSYAGLGWQPISAGAWRRCAPVPTQVFGRYNDGGPLIWFVPEKRVFSDTRQDPYPLAITRETSSRAQRRHLRDTASPANAWPTGISSMALTLTRGGSVATQWTVSATSSASSGSAPS